MSAATPRPAAPASVAHASRPARLTARIALLGASGYSGQEFARLALRHPGLDLALLGSREHAGRPASELIVGLDSRAAALPAVADLDGVAAAVTAGRVDTVVACLPHGAWADLSRTRPGLLGHTGAGGGGMNGGGADGGDVNGTRANGAGGPAPADTKSAAGATAPALRIIDLSSDHRDGSDGYVYGLPEAFRAQIAGATRVANPGCYPTAAMLALLPALEAGWIGGPVLVSAISGVSGAGRQAALRTSFVERDGGAELYRAGTEHAHVAEMERQLGRVAGAGVEIGFAPQIVPMARGILLVANAPLARPVSPADAREAYGRRYAHEPFARLLPADAWPDTRAVRGSNRCDVAVTTLHGGRTLMVASAIDNLVKGAAGQAIQNLNLLLGWPETTGLATDGIPW